MQQHERERERARERERERERQTGIEVRRGEQSADEREEGGGCVLAAASPVISPSLTWGGCCYGAFATDPASCALYLMLFL